MIDDFKPYMTAETRDGFRGYLDEIGAARDETTSSVELAVDDPGGKWLRTGVRFG